MSRKELLQAFACYHPKPLSSRTECTGLCLAGLEHAAGMDGSCRQSALHSLERLPRSSVTGTDNGNGDEPTLGTKRQSAAKATCDRREICNGLGHRLTENVPAPEEIPWGDIRLTACEGRDTLSRDPPAVRTTTSLGCCLGCFETPPTHRENGAACGKGAEDTCRRLPNWADVQSRASPRPPPPGPPKLEIPSRRPASRQPSVALPPIPAPAQLSSSLRLATVHAPRQMSVSAAPTSSMAWSSLPLPPLIAKHHHSAPSSPNRPTSRQVTA
jgi:hypothetical protein